MPLVLDDACTLLWTDEARGDEMTAMARDACLTRDMAHANVAAIVATCFSTSHQQQQQQPATLRMLLYAIDATDCHNLKLFLQRCRVADVSNSPVLTPLNDLNLTAKEINIFNFNFNDLNFKHP